MTEEINPLVDRYDLTASSVAVCLGCSVRQARYLMEDGTIASIDISRVPGRRAYRTSAGLLREYLEQARVDPGA